MDITKIMDKHSEEVCTLCEAHYEGIRSGYPNLPCEGRYCEEMVERFLEEQEDEEELEVCPTCGKKSVDSQIGGGVKCLMPECDYWECF